MSVAARAHSSYARFGLLMLMSCLRRIENATRLFERLLSLRNDPGLLAEEYDHVRGRLVGSFPQAFSHIGLVNTAYNLIEVRRASDPSASHLRTAARKSTISRRVQEAAFARELSDIVIVTSTCIRTARQ